MDMFTKKHPVVLNPGFAQAYLFRTGMLAAIGLLLIAGMCINSVAKAQAAASTGSSTVHITADHQQYDPGKRIYNLNGKVLVKYKDYVITGTEAKVDMDETGEAKVANFFHRPTVKHFKGKTATTPAGEDIILGDTVRIYLKDNLFGAEGNVVSHINTVAADPFIVWSDAQEIDNVRKIVTASGKVKVDYNKSIIYSNNALLRMNETGKADRVIFTGAAKLLKDTSEITGTIRIMTKPPIK
jgi:lipopolysaccharide export system protein LptA